MSESKEKTTITITRDAKKALDEVGRKDENYSDLIFRLASLCECTKNSTFIEKKDESKNE